jgi:hypothetical protein
MEVVRVEQPVVVQEPAEEVVERNQVKLVSQYPCFWGF